MNSKKIIFYQQDILFDILNEIKEKLDFDLIKVGKNFFKDYKKMTKTDVLFISNLVNNEFENKLLIDDSPIKIEKLIEQINLKFLKEKFQYQSKVFVGSYKLDLNSREISKNDKSLDLTEREINLILFLKETPKAVKIEKLQKEVWDYNSKLDTHTVETHIYRLRKKVKSKFEDENFILNSKDGYFL